MNKTVLITGASSGIGRETARYFHQQGWNVIATMRAPEKETELSTLDHVLVTRLDVLDKQSITDAVNAGVNTFGSIDVLVNNAGYGAVGVLEAAPEDTVRRQFDVNLFGLIDVTRAVLPVMRKNRSGVIINLSSMGGRITIPFGTLYNSTKFALEGLTEALQFELNPLGIRTKLIEPGSYRTNFAGSSMTWFGAGDISDYKDIFDAFTAALQQPGRGNPNVPEVSAAIWQAATDGSEQLRYVVGNDAAMLIRTKEEQGDIAYKKMIAGRFGL